MSNSNPIYLDSDSVLTPYVIPIDHVNDLIYLSIWVILLDNGWQFAPAHSIFLKGVDIFPQKSPNPINLKIDLGKNLGGSKFGVNSQISRIRNGNINSIPSHVEYHLKLTAGDQLLDEFIMKSDTNNPSDFNSLLLFNI